MRQHRHAFACIVLAMAGGAALLAQEQPAAQLSAPLQVQVVISRYQGDKKVSTLPYSLSVEPGRKTSLRMGAEVPVTMTTSPPRGAWRDATRVDYLDFRLGHEHRLFSRRDSTTRDSGSRSTSKTRRWQRPPTIQSRRAEGRSPSFRLVQVEQHASPQGRSVNATDVRIRQSQR